MAYGNRVKTDSITTVYDSEVYPVGSVFVQPADELVADESLQGDRTWLFIESDGGCTQDALLKRSSNTASYKATDSSAANITELINLIGIANHEIPTGKYGWIIVKGETQVLGAVAVTNGNNLVSTSGGAGKCKPAAGGNTDSFAVFGRAIETTGGAATVKCYVDFR